MNAAQIHLALNHVPLFLSIIGGGILILGMIRKNESFKTLSLYILAAAALFTAPVFLTGEGTEELVEKLPGVQEAMIEEHEEMAKIALIVIVITGIVALAGLLFRKRAGIAKLILPVALLLSLGSFAVMAQTAHLGGLIRHSELNSGQRQEAAGDPKEGEEKDSNNKEQEKMNKESEKQASKKEDDD